MLLKWELLSVVSTRKEFSAPWNVQLAFLRGDVAIPKGDVDTKEQSWGACLVLHLHGDEMQVPITLAHEKGRRSSRGLGAGAGKRMVLAVPSVPHLLPPEFLECFIEEEEGLCKKNPTPAHWNGREKKTLPSTMRKRINQAKRS